MYKIKKTVEPYMFVFPAAALMCLFIVYSVCLAIQISLTDWSGMAESNFIGLANYVKILQDSTFWNSIRVQFTWVLMSVTFLPVAGLTLSIIVEFFIARKLSAFFRTVFFMPMMTSLVAVGILWSLIYNPMIGILSELLSVLGILQPGQTIDLLGNSSLALYCAFVPAVWQWAGYGMVIFSAAMQGISNDVIEASRIDGCTRLKQIRYIIVPLLKPTIATVAVLNLIGGFKCFDLIYVMTKGGPGIATKSTTIYIYEEMFTNSNYGYSAAMAMILFLITITFSAFFFRLTRKLED